MDYLGNEKYYLSTYLVVDSTFSLRPTPSLASMS